MALVKGKRRALSFSDPDTAERAPLLPDSPPIRHGRGPLLHDSDDEGDSALAARRGLRPRRVLWILSLSTLALLGLAVAVAHVWVGGLISEQAKRDGGPGEDMLEVMGRRGLVWAGPHAVRLIPGGQDSVLLEVDAELGLDARRALGWEFKDDASAPWYRRVEASVARWSVSHVHSSSVDLDRISIRTSHDDELVTIHALRRITIPLSYPRSHSLATLEPVTLRIPIKFPSPDLLGSLLRQIWDDKAYTLRLHVGQVSGAPTSVKGMVGRFLGRNLRFGMDDVGKDISGKRELPLFDSPTLTQPTVPTIPGASDPASLVELVDYTLYSSPAPSPAYPNSTVVSIRAHANVTNPLASRKVLDGALRELAWGVPWAIPVQVYLPQHSDAPAARSGKHASRPLLLATAHTSPLTFASAERSSPLEVLGQLVAPIANATEVEAAKAREGLSRALSGFLERYLGGQNNTILVRYDPAPSLAATAMPTPPKFVESLMRDVTIPLTFPGTSSPLALFKNLRIDGMKIKLASFAPLASFLASDDEDPTEDFLCSGTVVGEITLPEMMSDLAAELFITGIKPDVLVYDGEPPLDRQRPPPRTAVDQLAFLEEDTAGANEYPPSPLPATAFARLRPLSFIAATTTHYPANETHPALTILTATFVDAPLFLLEKRGEVFRRFMGRIIFGGPNARVRTGVRGESSAAATLGGLGDVQLDGLPIEGAFWVGGRGLGI